MPFFQIYIPTRDTIVWSVNGFLQLISHLQARMSRIYTYVANVHYTDAGYMNTKFVHFMHSYAWMTNDAQSNIKESTLQYYYLLLWTNFWVHTHPLTHTVAYTYCINLMQNDGCGLNDSEKISSKGKIRHAVTYPL